MASPQTFTTEAENSYRIIRLLIGPGLTASREVLDIFSQRLHAKTNFDGVLMDPAVQNCIKNLVPRPMNTQQWKVIFGEAFPQVDPACLGSIKDYDTTLITLLIRNICGLRPSRDRIWDNRPALTDHSLEANIACLKYYRNDMAHHPSGEISDTEFNDIFNHIKQAVLQISNTLSSPSWQITAADIDRYRTDPISPHDFLEIQNLLREWHQERNDVKNDVKTLFAILTEIVMDSESSRTCVKKGFCMLSILIFIGIFVFTDTYPKELQMELKGLYNVTMAEIQFNPMSPQTAMPLKDLYVKPVWVSQQKQSVNEELLHIANYIELFKGIDNLGADKKKSVKRILVTGEAGVGKTTFLKKLVYDWTHGNDEYLKRFENVFLVSLGNVKAEQSIVEMLKEQLLPYRPDLVSKLGKYLGSCRNCLLLLDGFDDLGRDNRPVIRNIFNFHLRNLVVLITSRPWSVEDLVLSASINDNYVEIKGFTREDASIFLEKIFLILYEGDKDLASTTSGNLMNDLSKRRMRDLLKIPLVLNMIALLYHHEKKLPETSSSFYKEIVELMYKISFKRSDNNLQKPDELNNILMKSGKLGFEGLIKEEHDQLFFEYDEVVTQVGDKAFEMGLISLERSTRGIGKDTRVFFPHKSFQEYAAANYLNQELIDNNDKPWLALKYHIINTGSLGNYDILLHFAAGVSVTFGFKIQDFLDEMLIDAFKNDEENNINLALKLHSYCLKNMPGTTQVENIYKPVKSDHELENVAANLNKIAWVIVGYSKYDGYGHYHTFQVTPKTVSLLRNILDKNKRNVSIYLSNVEGKFTYMVSLFKLLRNHANVKYTYLKCGTIKYKDFEWKQLLPLILQSKGLLGLDLLSCNFPCNLLSDVGRFLNRSRRMYQLKLSLFAAADYFHLLSDEIDLNNDLDLSHLDLRFKPLNDEDSKALSLLLHKSPNLKYLHLSRNSVDFTDALLNLQLLRSFIFYGWDINTTDIGIRPGLQTDKLWSNLDLYPNLKILKLPNHSLNDENMADLKLTKISTLETLDLNNNNIGIDGFRHLIKNAKYLPNLKILNLSGNEIFFKAKTELIQLIKTFKHLLRVNLSGNKMYKFVKAYIQRNEHMNAIIAL